jgi:hypothetical protein
VLSHEYVNYVIGINKQNGEFFHLIHFDWICVGILYHILMDLIFYIGFNKRRSNIFYGFRCEQCTYIVFLTVAQHESCTRKKLYLGQWPYIAKFIQFALVVKQVRKAHQGLAFLHIVKAHTHTLFWQCTYIDCISSIDLSCIRHHPEFIKRHKSSFRLELVNTFSINQSNRYMPEVHILS